MSVQIKKNGVWEAVAGNATNTSGITESSALANIGTSANATQHDVNVAVDDAFSLLKGITKKGFSVPVPLETSTNNSWLVTVHSKEINYNSLGAAFVTRNENILYIFNISLITSGVMITIQEDEDNVGQIKTNYTGLNYSQLMNWNFKPMGKFLF